MAYIRCRTYLQQATDSYNHILVTVYNEIDKVYDSKFTTASLKALASRLQVRYNTALVSVWPGIGCSYTRTNAPRLGSEARLSTY